VVFLDELFVYKAFFFIIIFIILSTIWNQSRIIDLMTRWSSKLESHQIITLHLFYALAFVLVL